MLSLSSEIATPFHRLPAGLKLAVLVLSTIGLYAVNAPLALLLACGVVAALFLIGGIRFARLGLAMLRPLWPFLAIILVWQWLRGDPRDGLAVILRILALVALANLVTLTSRLDDLLTVVERGLHLLRLNPRTVRRISLAVVLVIRFVPVLSEKGARLGDAWRARSTSRRRWRLILPFTLLAIDDAERVGDALRARGGIE